MAKQQDTPPPALDTADGDKQETFDAAYVKKLRDEAAKTEAQKTADRLAALESELAGERAEKLRAQVAAAKGLTPAMARRLAGATREELEADAEELLADIGTKYAPKSATPEQTGAGATGEPPAAGPSLEMAQALTRR